MDGTGQNHKLQTKYAYNTLGQVVWQQTPDAGESKFWIDYYGRVKLSQNAEQKEHSDYAYSKFDELGRPYEVGKLSSSGNLRLEVEGNNPLTLLEKSELIFDSDFPRAGSVTLLQVNGGTPTFNFTLSERIKTFYDKHDATGIVDPIEQKNLKNRVAAVVVMEEGETVGAVTRYSYDIHGNVEKLWQQLPQETGLPEKTVEYNYDLLSGKVNEVVYEGGKTDEFRHRYLYDGDNRLTQVETSLDGYHWTLEASYFYYAHGPLARIETGQHNIQGTDYFYTLQGWIKGVNSIGLTHTRQDPGRDGYTGYTEEEAQNPTFNRDEYAYALNYYEGDYEAREGNISLGKCFWFNEIYNNKFSGYKDAVGGVEYNRESLYNGNIAAMATSIRHFGELKATQSMNYRYDQLHRIAAAEATEWGEQGWYTQQASYRTSYAYDGNGNIKKLLRNNRDGVKIDELRYSYDPIKKNRLDAVQDIGGTAEGLNNAAPYQYKYDKIGNLVQNTTDGIADIEWNIYGKVEKVTKTPDPFGIQATVEYRYDGTGNRIMKKITAGATSTTTTYLRDASGNVMAIYEEKTDQTLAIKEIPIYGSSRLGQYRPKTDAKKTALGQRIYEFSNHLGNVLVTLTDNKVPQTDGTYECVVVSASDYYPFGMAMAERTYSNSEYRYGFNGKEKDWDIAVGKTDFGARIYDELTGRWFSLDEHPKTTQSNYVFAVDNPIIFIDPDGKDDFYFDGKTNTWEVLPSPYPNTFTKIVYVSDGEGGTMMSIRSMSEDEVGAAMFSNNKLYLRAMKGASTTEDANRMRYLYSQAFGEAAVHQSHKDARPLIIGIGGLILAPLAAAAFGEAALTEFLLEETVEYILDEAGLPIPIINDPTDLVEQVFKKTGKKTTSKLASGVADNAGGAGRAVMGSKQRWSNDEMRELSRQYGDVEVAQIYVMGKGKNGGGGHYEIYVGTKSNVNIPNLDEGKMLINHTHPIGGSKVASSNDRRVLKNAGMFDSPQVSSEIIHMDGGTTRFNHTLDDIDSYLKAYPKYKRPLPYD